MAKGFFHGGLIYWGSGSWFHLVWLFSHRISNSSLNRFRDSEARKFTTPHSTLLVSIRGSHIPDCPFPKEYLEIGRYKLLKGSCRSFKSRFIPSQSEMNMLWVEGEWFLTTPDAINIKSHQSLLVWGRPTQLHLWHGTCHGIPCSSRGFPFP